MKRPLRFQSQLLIVDWGIVLAFALGSLWGHVGHGLGTTIPWRHVALDPMNSIGLCWLFFLFKSHTVNRSSKKPEVFVDGNPLNV